MKVKNETTNENKTMKITSIQIRKEANGGEIEILGSIGEGDNKITLCLLPDGREVIETCGEPVWDGEIGFAEAREKILG